MWNRIYSAAVWVPNGNATSADCKAGVTFYSGASRVQKVGGGVLDGGECATTADCYSSVCTQFYQDSDGDLYGNAGVPTKRCGTVYTGYVTDNADANDAQACASGANPTGTCNKCVNGAIANQTNAEDVFTECAGPSINACSGATPVGPNGLCNGSGSCDATSNTATACATAGTCQTGGCSAGSCVAIGVSPVGTSCGGGKVAYVSGIHGFISATSDLGPMRWGCYNIDIPGASGVYIGTGRQNTLNMIASSCTTGVAAAAYRGGGYADWYIPSENELVEMWGRQALIGNFISNYYYWTSSEVSSTQAKSLYTPNGGRNPSDKDAYPFYLRLIRDF